MNPYNSTVARIEAYARGLNPFENLDRFQQFSFFSANLTNFLPLLDQRQHLALFREAYINQQLSLLDEKYFGGELPLQVQGWDQELVDRLRERPGIICTCHAGSYRMINYMLVTSRLPFALLIAGEAHRQQGPTFHRLFETMKHRHGLRHELFLIDAEQPAAVWQLMRLIKKGYNIVVYLDGFTGMSVSDTSKLEQIPFLGQHLFVRRGAAYLAWKLGIPLYPIFCARLSRQTVRFFPGTPRTPQGDDPARATSWALSMMLGEFAGLMLHFPAQWENWFFLHHQFAIHRLRNVQVETSAVPPPLSTVPDPAEYGLIGQQGQYFLLKKKGYKVYPLPYKTMKLVWEKWNTP